MRPYEERKAARIDRLRARAEKARAGSESAFGAAKRLADAIPLGQPVLVGHHSERRHRRDLARIDGGMRKGVDLDRAASELDRRADAAESNDAISSDDPHAWVKLRARIGELCQQRDRMKQLNALFRKDQWAAVERHATPEEMAEMRRNFAYSPGGTDVPFPSYTLSNLGANIRRLEQRAERLKARAERPAPPELVIGPVTIDEQDNRTRIHFPGKPAAEVIGELKANGFRWCRTDGCWQRHAGAYARTQAEAIVRRHYPAEEPAPTTEREPSHPGEP